MKTLLEAAARDQARRLSEEEISQASGGVPGDWQGHTIAHEEWCWSDELGTTWLEGRLFD